MTDRELRELNLLRIVKRFIQDRLYKSPNKLNIHKQFCAWCDKQPDHPLALEILDMTLHLGEKSTNVKIFLQECDEAYSFVIQQSQQNPPDKAEKPPTTKKAEKKKPSQATPSATSKGSATQ